MRELSFLFALTFFYIIYLFINFFFNGVFLFWVVVIIPRMGTRVHTILAKGTTEGGDFCFSRRWTIILKISFDKSRQFFVFFRRKDEKNIQCEARNFFLYFRNNNIVPKYDRVN